MITYLSRRSHAFWNLIVIVVKQDYISAISFELKFIIDRVFS